MFLGEAGLGRDLLIGDIFQSAASAVPHRVAAVLGDTELSFAEIDGCANRVARALARFGIGRGDRVVVWSTTALDTVPVFAATAKLGAIFAPMNAGLSVEEGAAMAGTIRPAAILVDAERSRPGAEVAARLGAAAVSITGLASSPAPAESNEIEADIPILAHLAAAEDGSDVRCQGLREQDPHVIFFTSGSTGRPKGVVICHRVSYLRTHPGALLEPRGAMVCPYPLFHMGAWTIAMQQWQA